MKKVVIILIVIIMISQPVSAFSISDILENFRDIFTGFSKGNFITGEATKTCSDGTDYGDCSITQPLYCSFGNLIEDCSTCGCELGYECSGSTNTCEPSGSNQCSDGTIYG